MLHDKSKHDLPQGGTASPKPAALPPSLADNPRLSSWLRFGNGEVMAYSGKVDIGQGILTALAQIVADELDVDLARVRMMPAVTGTSPDEAVTSGSLSIQHSGTALRHACAQARASHLAHAARALGVAPERIDVRDGDFVLAGRLVGSYWQQAGAGLLDTDAQPGVRTKPAGERRVVGRSLPRDDIARKVFGTFRFIQDIVLPGMVHGRIVRPPSPAAVLRDWPVERVESMAGVMAVVRSGSQAGVIAGTETQAQKAAEALANAAGWEESPTLPDDAQLASWLRNEPVNVTEVSVGNDEAAAKVTGLATFSADYSKPFMKHASIATSCALALDRGSVLEVWTHSQGIYNLRRDLATALGRTEESVVVHHVPGAGCYGHNGADDVAFDAAWLATRHPGEPVRVLWSRSDELRWSPLGPAMSVHLEADVDAQGRVAAWRHTLWSPGHGLRPGRKPTPTLLGAWYQDPPFPRIPSFDAAPATGGGADRNGLPVYAFGKSTLICRRLVDAPVRTSALRGLGAYANVFAIESFMDELAEAHGIDPLDYRLSQLDDARAIDVAKAATAGAGWAGKRSQGGEGLGIGMGVARYKGTSAYCAVVAEVEVSHRVVVKKLTVAVDVGLVVNPDGVINQIEGGAIQATSMALFEAARFDGTRVVSDAWERYPILRFEDVPEVEVLLLDRPDLPSLGAGEASMGPTVAAIGNALAHALGVRVRDLPLTPERVMAAIDAA